MTKLDSGCPRALISIWACDMKMFESPLLYKVGLISNYLPSWSVLEALSDHPWIQATTCLLSWLKGKWPSIMVMRRGNLRSLTSNSLFTLRISVQGLDGIALDTRTTVSCVTSHLTAHHACTPWVYSSFSQHCCWMLVANINTAHLLWLLYCLWKDIITLLHVTGILFITADSLEYLPNQSYGWTDFMQNPIQKSVICDKFVYWQNTHIPKHYSRAFTYHQEAVVNSANL